ncbi:hypothetical protein VQ03_04535 [Methylobacterium tarhaniae]|uniref:Uncharacterized protein n=1 Tax=Methylobacterium tarhaniae TaxID=1187852 RepID=A0A0J6TEU9_9HYPH|nr:hypothetical protein VQ03_04535 [Methylobacterium tarhaniae]
MNADLLIIASRIQAAWEAGKICSLVGRGSGAAPRSPSSPSSRRASMPYRPAPWCGRPCPMRRLIVCG